MLCTMHSVLNSTVFKHLIHCYFFLFHWSLYSEQKECFILRQTHVAFVWDTYCGRHCLFFFFLSQPKRGKGRGVFSSSSSALKEKLEEKRREIIIDYYLLCATRLTFNIEVDLSQKYLKGFQKVGCRVSVLLYTFKLLFLYSLTRIILR